jgi:hypothetical protein
MRSRTGALGLVAALALGSTACTASHYAQVSCEGAHRQSIFILAAEAVPSATFIPCIEPLPAGWTYAGSEVRSGSVRFWLDSDRVGTRAIEVTMSSDCDLAGSVEVAAGSGPSGLRLYEGSEIDHPDATVLHYVFPGGCVTSRLSFTRSSAPSIFEEADRLLGFTPRSVYTAGVQNDEGLTLCGAGAPPCPG